MIDRKKLREKLGIRSYADACGYAVAVICVIFIIVASCIDPLARAIFACLFAIVAVVCLLGYLIYKLFKL